MPLSCAQPALALGSTRTGLTTPSTAAAGMLVASTRPARRSLVLVTGPMNRSDRVATLDEAKAQFQMSWDAWKAWAHFIIRDDVELTRVRWCALEQQVRHARILPFDDGGAKTTGEVGSVG